MPCGHKKMKFSKALGIVKEEYPDLNLGRQEKIAGKIIRGKKK